MPQELSLREKRDTLKLRRRPLRRHGLVKSLAHVLGRPFSVETDHKPLVPLLNTKHLDDLPPRILSLRLRLAKYDYVAHHVLGKLLYAADALSRAPSSQALEREDEELQKEAQAYVDFVTLPSIPATPQRLNVYKQAQVEDKECS